MATVSIKCPNCGGALELDDSKEFGFCIFCGAQVRVQDEKTRIEVSGSVTFDESKKYENFLTLASQAFSVGNMEEAYQYYTRALEIKQSDYLPVFRKALCAGYVSAGVGARVEEVVSGVSRAFDLASDDSAKDAMSADILAFASNTWSQLSTAFYSSDECNRYVKILYCKVVLLNRLYSFVNKDDEASVIPFIDITLQYCTLLSRSTLQFQTGTKVVDGKSEPTYGTYPVPQNVLADVANIRHRFSEEYNQFLRPKIQELEADIQQTKSKIKELPTALRFLGRTCGHWVLLALIGLGLFFMVTPVAAFVLWIAQFVARIIYKVMDTDNAASTLFQTLKSQEGELSALKKKLR